MRAVLRGAPRRTLAVILLSALWLPACGSDTPEAPSAREFQQVGCTTLRSNGQDFNFSFDTVCRSGGLTTVSLGTGCSVIVGCLTNRCLAGCETGKSCSCS